MVRDYAVEVSEILYVIEKPLDLIKQCNMKKLS